MLSFESKGGVQSPKRFLDDNIEERIRSIEEIWFLPLNFVVGLFHYEYFSNDVFGIKYKLKKKPGFDKGSSLLSYFQVSHMNLIILETFEEIHPRH